ncbi:hypothetical protein B0H13DRAFT_1891437 [Mycena leptocephala]|nr:hypothetical protein B0H13DRAFT_1891437 [Mycena leptocephala]
MTKAELWKSQTLATNACFILRLTLLGSSCQYDADFTRTCRRSGGWLGGGGGASQRRDSHLTRVGFLGENSVSVYKTRKVHVEGGRGAGGEVVGGYTGRRRENAAPTWLLRGKSKGGVKFVSARRESNPEGKNVKACIVKRHGLQLQKNVLQLAQTKAPLEVVGANTEKHCFCRGSIPGMRASGIVTFPRFTLKPRMARDSIADRFTTIRSWDQSKNDIQLNFVDSVKGNFSQRTGAQSAPALRLGQLESPQSSYMRAWIKNIGDYGWDQFVREESMKVQKLRVRRETRHDRNKPVKVTDFGDVG